MKISLVGIGNVGGSLASYLVMKNLVDELAIVDINENFAKAKEIDLSQSAAAFGFDIKINSSSSYEAIKNSDIIVISAGMARKDGQSRAELEKINSDILESISKEILKFSPQSILIVVTNPLDRMVENIHKFTNFDKAKILGMAGELDSARAIYEISKEFDIKFSQTRVKFIGLHNDSMVFLSSFMSENLKNLDKLRRQAAIAKAKTGGAKIVKLMNTSAYFAPAAAILKMIENIMGLRDDILSVSVLDEENRAYGRLVKLSKDGVSEILEMNLTEEENKNLKQSLI